MCTHHISIAQLFDSTGEGIAEFRIEIAVSEALEDIGSSYEYCQCGVDEEGRELYVSPWLNLKSVMEEVERISSELKLQGRDFAVSSVVRSRVVDTLQE
nr:hypothetical protein [Candidatus Njordarchaeota archaeon]